MKRAAGTVALLVLVLLLTGCESISYYGQAARGQLAQVFGARPIASLLNDETLSDNLRERLQLVLDIRQFAGQQMDLPVGSSYLRYLDLQRDYLVWNVFAAPAFTIAPLNWCYPIAGCVSYRGYFNERDALAKAAELEQQGYDVYVGGVDAYSTLGWFSDPVNSAFIRRSEPQLVNLIAHELAHQQVYVPGDTVFNESFASFVGQEAVRRWSVLAESPEILQRYQHDEQVQSAFVALIMQYQDRLQALYSEGGDERFLGSGKQAIQQQLREEYADLREQWDDRRYDRWFAGPLNNAQLLTVSAYNASVPAFSVMLDQCRSDMACFYAKVENLAALDAEARSAQLDRLLHLAATGSTALPGGLPDQ